MILQREFESYLNTRVKEFLPSRTKEAMTYSLMNGGKRIRPQLLFAALKGYGIDPEIGFPCACAIEMIHTYSLIHDDLPSMDNDDFRRGQPSCHKAFDEATAILAGDGLLTKSFEVVLDTNCSNEQKVQLVQALSRYSGIDGMIYGQDQDLYAEGLKEPSFELLMKIDEFKTSKLLTLPLVCASIIANRQNELEIMKKIGLYVGIQFQLQDDILDVIQSSEILGKSTSDVENNKMTAVTVLGLQKAQNLVNKYQELLTNELMKLEEEHKEIRDIFDYLVKRTY